MSEKAFFSSWTNIVLSNINLPPGAGWDSGAQALADREAPDPARAEPWAARALGTECMHESGVASKVQETSIWR